MKTTLSLRLLALLPDMCDVINELPKNCFLFIEVVKHLCHANNPTTINTLLIRLLTLLGL